MKALRKPAVILASALALSGCIDVDVGMDFSDGEAMKGSFVLSMARQLYDMTAASKPDFCKDGKTQLTKDAFHCATERSVPLDELLEKGTVALGEGDIRPEEGLKVERIDENRIRVAFDFTSMPQEARPETAGGMEDMLRAAVAGHSFTFRVKGYKILSSTGVISEDGREASHVIPLAAFIENPPNLGPAFVSEVQLRQVCRFWVFCD